MEKINITPLAQKLEYYGQGQLLSFYAGLEKSKQEQLLEDINKINFDLIKSLSSEHLESLEEKSIVQKRDPIDALDVGELSQKKRTEFEDIGNYALSQGKVAAFLVAGGQGTRLGHELPKGTLDIGLPSGKSLYELQAQRLKAVSKKAGKDVPWYIMLNPVHAHQSIAFFKEHGYFGVPSDSVHFILQNMMPAVDKNGKIILADKHKISLSPDGNGGCFQALIQGGSLAEMKQNGVEYFFFYGVDNALIKMMDPLFIGYTIASGQQIGCKVVEKMNPEEKVGLLMLENGKPKVIEYSDMPGDLLFEKNARNRLKFSNGNIMMHLFKVDFIEQFGKERLPYHRAHKAIAYIDDKGCVIKPDSPNGYKFEQFVFDVFPRAGGVAALAVKREEEFAPVKNRTGVDSMVSAREMVMNLYKQTGDDILI
ncbi:MAG: UDPGP type 1 family protein [Fibrobacteria bacterium]|nr:UDPGP type 1 family protein [Fibrobacteria bacterium]